MYTIVTRADTQADGETGKATAIIEIQICLKYPIGIVWYLDRFMRNNLDFHDI